jgi:hypothetical protein
MRSLTLGALLITRSASLAADANPTNELAGAAIP